MNSVTRYQLLSTNFQIYPTMSPAHSMYGGQVHGYPQPGFVPQYYQGGPVPQGYPQAQHFMPRQEKVLKNSVFGSPNQDNNRTEICRNSDDLIKFTKKN